MPTSGSAREKLRWIFEMYDEDRSGGDVERWRQGETNRDFVKVRSECRRC